MAGGVSATGPTVSTVRHLVAPHTGSVDALATHPRLPLYASAGTNRVISIWNAETCVCVGAQGEVVPFSSY